jgi:hypothetical protein
LRFLSKSTYLLINSVLTGEATTEPPIRNTTRMIDSSLMLIISEVQVKNPLEKTNLYNPVMHLRLLRNTKKHF